MVINEVPGRYHTSPVNVAFMSPDRIKGSSQQPLMLSDREVTTLHAYYITAYTYMCMHLTTVSKKILSKTYFDVSALTFDQHFLAHSSLSNMYSAPSLYAIISSTALSGSNPDK